MYCSASPTESLSTTLRLEGDGDEVDPYAIRLIDRSYVKALSIQVRGILLQEENAGGKMEIGAFKEKFLKRLVFQQLCSDYDGRDFYDGL